MNANCESSVSINNMHNLSDKSPRSSTNFDDGPTSSVTQVIHIAYWGLGWRSEQENGADVALSEKPRINSREMHP